MSKSNFEKIHQLHTFFSNQKEKDPFEFYAEDEEYKARFKNLDILIQCAMEEEKAIKDLNDPNLSDEKKRVVTDIREALWQEEEMQGAWKNYQNNHPSSNHAIRPTVRQLVEHECKTNEKLANDFFNYVVDNINSTHPCNIDIALFLAEIIKLDELQKVALSEGKAKAKAIDQGTTLRFVY